MGGLELLSGLNWAMAVLYGCVGLVGLMVMPMPAALVWVVMLLLVALPHVYLGLNIEKGRGRTLQTIFAVLSLLNFPLGTAFGVFALMTVWSSANAELFEDGPKSYVDELPDVDQVDLDESPYAMAKRLKESGLRAGSIRTRLNMRGLQDDEIETVLGALGLSTSARAPAPARRPSAKPARAPRDVSNDVTDERPAIKRPKRPVR